MTHETTSLNGKRAVGGTPKLLRGKPRKFKQSQVVALTMAFNAHGVKDGSGVYTYQPGYGDEAVRNEVDRSLSLDRVAEFRRDHFGRLQSELKASGGGGSLASRVAELEARMKLIEARLDPIADALLPKADPSGGTKA